MDDWNTPKWFMPLVSDLFDRVPPNETDALTTEWTCDSYVNPPYSDPLPFILKGIDQNKKHDIVVVFLLKLDTTTKWWLALENAGAHFLFFRERLHYSESKESPPFSSVLAILSQPSKAGFTNRPEGKSHATATPSQGTGHEGVLDNTK
jgi:hypothetical protein